MRSKDHFPFNHDSHNRARCLAALLVLACLPVMAAAKDDFIQGSASYRERIALTPDAMFEATLQDVSLADAPAKVLGRVSLPAPKKLPIKFRIPYDARTVEPHRTYSVRATIRRAEKLIFVTDQFYPVLTGRHAKRVTLVMRYIGNP